MRNSIVDVLTAIKERRSIRRFLDKKIPDEYIDVLKDAIIWAPSAGNLQSRRFYFVYNEGLKKELSTAALRQKFISTAPLVVVACANLMIGLHYGKRGEKLYAIQDAAASIQNMMLAAHSIGLGSVWVGAFNEDEVARLLNLPIDIRPLAIVPVGYPSHNPSPPSRVNKDKAIIEIK